MNLSFSTESLWFQFLFCFCHFYINTALLCNYCSFNSIFDEIPSAIPISASKNTTAVPP